MNTAAKLGAGTSQNALKCNAELHSKGTQLLNIRTDYGQVLFFSVRKIRE